MQAGAAAGQSLLADDHDPAAHWSMGRTRECRYGNIGRGEVRRLSALAALALMKELIVQL